MPHECPETNLASCIHTVGLAPASVAFAVGYSVSSTRTPDEAEVEGESPPNLKHKAARKYGVEYAKELAGHTSDRYIWRYVQLSDAEKEEAVDNLF